MRCTRRVLQQFPGWTYTTEAIPNWAESSHPGLSFLTLLNVATPFAPSLSSPAEVVYTGCIANINETNVKPSNRNDVLWRTTINYFSDSFPDPFRVDAVVPVLNLSNPTETSVCYLGQECALTVATVWAAWPFEGKKNYCVESCFVAGSDDDEGGTIPASRSSRDVVILSTLRTMDDGAVAACLCVPRRAPLIDSATSQTVGALTASGSVFNLTVDQCINGAVSGFVVLQANFYCGPTAIRTTTANGTEGPFVCNSGCQARTEDGCCFPGTYVSLGVSSGGDSSDDDSSDDAGTNDDQGTVDWLQWAILCVIIFGCVEGAAFWVFQRAYFRTPDEEERSGKSQRHRSLQTEADDEMGSTSGGGAPLLHHGAMSSLTEAESIALADAMIDQRYVPPPLHLPLQQPLDNGSGSLLHSSFGGGFDDAPGGDDDDAQEMLFLYQEVRKHLTEPAAATPAAGPGRLATRGGWGGSPPAASAGRRNGDNDVGNAGDATAAETDRIFSEIFGISPVAPGRTGLTATSFGGQSRSSAGAEGNEAGRDRCPICLEDISAHQHHRGGSSSSRSSGSAVSLECRHRVHRECLKRYVSHRVRRRETLKCPVFGCSLVLE
jgi:hypothetical protein